MSKKQGLSRDDTNKIHTLLKALEKEEEAYEFMTPVDYKALGLDDYPLIIKNPMDLGTIGRKLKMSQYDTIQEVISDIMLIWDNCRTYNLMDSPIVQQAESMERAMKEQCKRFKIEGEFTRRVIGRRSADEIIKAEHPQIGEISLDEKVQLSEKVGNVSHPVLAQMVEIIKTTCISALEQLEDDKVQVKLDGLDRPTFDRISKLIADNQIV